MVAGETRLIEIRERSVELEGLAGVLKEIQGRKAVEDQGRPALVTAD